MTAEITRENIEKYALGDQEDNLCRLCFVKAFKLRSVFPYGDNPNNELFRQISALTSIKLNSIDEPNCCICSRCVNNLEELSKFQRQCVDNNRLLCLARGRLESKTISQELTTSTIRPRTVHVDEIDIEETQFAKLEPEDGDPFEADYTNKDFQKHGENNNANQRPVRAKKRPAKLASPTASLDEKKSRKHGKQALSKSEYDNTKMTNTGGRSAKKHEMQKLALQQSFEEKVDSDDSFEIHIPSRGKTRSLKSKTLRKKQVGKKIKTGRDFAVSTFDISEKDCYRNSSTNFRVNNTGHGVINIVFDNYRYFKFRYYKSTCGEVRYAWQCIEKDCSAQIYTRSTIRGRIFWKDRFKQHTHESDNADELLKAKLEDASFDRAASAELIGQIVLNEGRNRQNYIQVKLPNGEVVLVYGDHQHRLLLEKANGISVYGCIINSCRSIIHCMNNSDIKVYSGCSTAPEESFDLSYRKTLKVLSFENYYYMYSGRRIENRCAVWWCVLRRSHNCQTLLYVADGDLVIANRLHVKVPHTHSTNEYKFDDGTTIIEARRGDLPVESTNYHVAKNQAGTDFIIFEGLRYTIMNTKVDGTKACRCLEKASCGAYIYLSPNGTIVKFTNDNEHSHELPDQEKGIEEFDFVIETVHVEKTGSMFKWFNGNEYKRFCRRDNSMLYYRCTHKRNGCLASFTTSPDFSVLRENPEPHNHLPVQVEHERRRTLLEDEGTTNFKIELNDEGYDVLKYKSSRYCHFYNHKDGWRVWRCFMSSRCRATLFQNRSDGRVFDVDKFDHKHDGTRKFKEDDGEPTKTKKDSGNSSDSDSQDIAAWL